MVKCGFLLISVAIVTSSVAIVTSAVSTQQNRATIVSYLQTLTPPN
jgi:hypothetical protein